MEALSFDGAFIMWHMATAAFLAFYLYKLFIFIHIFYLD